MALLAEAPHGGGWMMIMEGEPGMKNQFRLAQKVRMTPASQKHKSTLMMDIDAPLWLQNLRLSLQT
eukprot:3496543-Prorocentrum_lima.AAC.1